MVKRTVIDTIRTGVSLSSKPDLSDRIYLSYDENKRYLLFSNDKGQTAFLDTNLISKFNFNDENMNIVVGKNSIPFYRTGDTSDDELKDFIKTFKQYRNEAESDDIVDGFSYLMSNHFFQGPMTIEFMNILNPAISNDDEVENNDVVPEVIEEDINLEDDETEESIEDSHSISVEELIEENYQNENRDVITENQETNIESNKPINDAPTEVESKENKKKNKKEKKKKEKKEKPEKKKGNFLSDNLMITVLSLVAIILMGLIFLVKTGYFYKIAGMFG